MPLIVLRCMGPEGDEAVARFGRDRVEDVARPVPELDLDRRLLETVGLREARDLLVDATHEVVDVEGAAGDPELGHSLEKSIVVRFGWGADVCAA